MDNLGVFGWKYLLERWHVASTQRYLRFKRPKPKSKEFELDPNSHQQDFYARLSIRDYISEDLSSFSPGKV